MNSRAPSFASFAAAYAQGKGALAWRVRVADLETPVAAFLKLAHGRPNSFLLESIEGGAARGRYSVIGFAPDLIWRCQDGKVSLNRDAAGDGAFVEDPRPALESLRAAIDGARLDVPPELPPMAGGLVGYLGYDMVRLMEDLPNLAPDDMGLPDAVLTRPSIYAVFDHVRDELHLIAPCYAGADLDPTAAWDQAQARLAAAETALDQALPVPPLDSGTQASMPEPSSNVTKPDFIATVLKMKEYIAAGDAFQIVPSQRFTAPFTLPPFALYRALRRINPAPFLFFLDFGGYAMVGSSPEILVRLREGVVTLRPLAGTRPRGATREEDQRLEAELLADPKERAEHLMLLDLGRNDVGRVAELTTVKVTASFAIERFSHVMHISSTVQGTIKPGLDALDALVAGFPAGTLTGAPKIRAMEIIEELEPNRRGIYAGCIGYFAANGTMDTCIGLRTALVKDGQMYVQAGCGVVADSNPEAEYEETRQKARALFRAAEEAVRFAQLKQ